MCVNETNEGVKVDLVFLWRRCIRRNYANVTKVKKAFAL